MHNLTQPTISYIGLCGSSNEYFLELSYIVHAIAIIVIYMNCFGVLYLNNLRIWLGFLVTASTAYTAKFIQDFAFQVPKPYPECVPAVALGLNISKNGLPDSNLVYLISMMVMSFYVYGFTLKKQNIYGRIRLGVAYVGTIIFLGWMYYHSWQLTILQILFSIFFAIFVSIIYMGIYLFLSTHVIRTYRWIKREIWGVGIHVFKRNLYPLLPI